MTYDHLTDEELLRHADGQSGLIKALSERLEMRIRDMKDIIEPSNIRRHNPYQKDLFGDSNA